MAGETALEPGAGHLIGPQRLLAAERQARAAWPRLLLSSRLFAAALERHAAASGNPDGWFARLHVSDLFLATACAEGTPGAGERLLELCRPQLVPALRRLDPNRDFIEDALQSLLQHLLLPGPERRPRIAGYRGDGPLQGWVRVTALRLGLRLHQRWQPRHEPKADPEPSRGREPSFVRRELYAEFRASLLEALAALPERDRLLLQRHHEQRQGIDRLATIYGVHRATAARWVAASRAALLRATRAGLLARTQIGEGEADSLMRSLAPELDVSIFRLLRP